MIKEKTDEELIENFISDIDYYLKKVLHPELYFERDVMVAKAYFKKEYIENLEKIKEILEDLKNE